MNRTLLASLLLFSLGACGDSQPAGKSTAKFDAVEVQPGSVSDSMIILDDANVDGTAVDNSVPDDGTQKDAAKPAQEGGEDAAADTGNEAEDAAAVPTPVAKKAAPADTAVKKGE